MADDAIPGDPLLRFLLPQVALGAGLAALALALLCSLDLTRALSLARGGSLPVLAGATLAGVLLPFGVAFAATALELLAQPPADGVACLA